MKKILILITSLAAGGAERTVSNLTLNLPENYEIDIMLNDTESIYYPYKGNIISLGMKRKKSKLSLWYQGIAFVKRFLLLKRIKKKNGYDLCVSFLDSANIVNILTGKKYCKTIVSVRNNLTRSATSKSYRYVVNPLVKILYNRANKVIAVAKGVEEDLILNHGIKREKVLTISNGYNLREIRQRMQEPLSIEEKTWFEDNNVIATVGRLSFQKAQWHLIRAFRQVAEEREDRNLKLLIMGAGEMEQALKKLAEECGVKDQVIFTGNVKNPFHLLKNCDMFVLPSLFEGFPNVLAEALCCGVPCISADYDSGGREILAPSTSISFKTSEIEFAEYGILVPVCDGKFYEAEEPLTVEEKKLTEAMRRLIDDETMRQKYHEQANRRAEEMAIEKRIDEWITLIDTI